MSSLGRLLLFSSVFNVLLLGAVFWKDPSCLHEGDVHNKYVQDTKSHWQRGCMYGAEYPRDWEERGKQSSGFNVYSRGRWCSIYFDEFIVPEVDKGADDLLDLRYKEPGVY